jgi:hypothetical protein
MPARKEAEVFASSDIKDCWHPYGLQGLSPDKFAIVATRILKGKFDLLSLKWKKRAQIREAGFLS